MLCFLDFEDLHCYEMHAIKKQTFMTILILWTIGIDLNGIKTCHSEGEVFCTKNFIDGKSGIIHQICGKFFTHLSPSSPVSHIVEDPQGHSFNKCPWTLYCTCVGLSLQKKHSLDEW